MDQLKFARQSLEIGRYQLALNAYQSCLLTFRTQIKQESDNESRNTLVELVKLIEKELELLKTLMSEMKNINVSPPTPETPTDPMVWPAPKTTPTSRLTLNRSKPPAPKKIGPTAKSAPKKSTNTSSANRSLPPKPVNIRRTTSQPKLHENYAAIDKLDKGSEAENEEMEDKVFDSSMYDRELVQLIETSVIQRNPNVRWCDISGHTDTKKTLTEAALLPHLFPSFFKGIRRPWKGVMLFGPSGTGKTMLAKAVATECKSTFFAVSASTLASKWRGDSEKLVRLLFEMARFYAPSTIFIDELDTVCAKRGSDNEHEASKRMKGELLVQIDGMVSDEGKAVLILAATNCPWDLDEAFRRRLEKRIYVGLPDHATRLDLLQNCLAMVKLENDVNLEELAKKTEGYSGADVTNFCRDAALQPMRECLAQLENYHSAAESLTTSQLEDKPIRMSHFRDAMSRVQPSSSHNDIKRYLDWQQKFGAI